tara:strand:- start:82 stop:1074 length:993 start_codon:yes stop_codon:yes gene_type:complete
MTNKDFTVGGLFSGVGGIELGFKNAGFEILWANEIDKYCAKTYQKNFDHTLYNFDLKQLKGSKVEPVDVLCGGFPCQAFSVAGYRKGFKDDRGNIFFEIIRLVNELKRKPKVLFLENVKNLKGHDGGKTFQTIVKIITDNGYSVFYDVLNTREYTALPQNRERTFIICFDGERDWEFMENCSKTSSYKFSTLFPPKTYKKTDHISKHLEMNVDEKYLYGEDKYMYKELAKDMISEDTLYQWRRKYVRENKNNVCPTLTANMGTGGHNVPLVKQGSIYRKLTPRECFNFQGFPKGFKFPKDVPNSQLYKQAGNAVSVPLIKILAKSIKEVI